MALYKFRIIIIIIIIKDIYIAQDR